MATAHSTSVRKASEADEIQRLLSQMLDLEPGLRRAFLEAVERLESRVDMARLIELLRLGRVDEALRTVEAASIAQSWQRLAVGATDAVSIAAIAALRAPIPAVVEISFSRTNPLAVSWMRRYETDLIREMTAETLGGVRAVLQRGLNEGRNPLDVARDVRSLIGLTQRQQQAVLNYRSALERGSRSALERALRDRRFDGTVRSAVQNNIRLAPEVIDKLVGRYRARYIQFRAQTIARTEAARALSMGNHLAWEQMITDDVIARDDVRRVWIHTHDDKVRDAHRTIPERNPDGVGMDEPFDSALGPILFPGDPAASAANTINCRCVVFYRLRPRPEDLL